MCGFLVFFCYFFKVVVGVCFLAFFLVFLRVTISQACVVM